MHVNNIITKICNTLETLSGIPMKLAREVNTKNINGSSKIDQTYNFDINFNIPTYSKFILNLSGETLLLIQPLISQADKNIIGRGHFKKLKLFKISLNWLM